MNDAQKMDNGIVYGVLCRLKFANEKGIRDLSGLSSQRVHKALIILQEHNMAAKSKDYWFAIELGRVGDDNGSIQGSIDSN